MDIEGVGEQFVRRLWDEGLLRSMPDLYRLTAEQLRSSRATREISARNAVDAIELSKQQPFSRVLFGLNIPDVGWVTARNLARHFGDVDRLLDASQEEIQEVEGIGPDRAEAIAEWFSDEQNRTLVAELRELGLRFEIGEEEKPVEGPLTGSQYVITGTLEAFTREEAKAALEALGAKVSDNVSKKTTGVFVGESPGSKVAKAQKAGVPSSPRTICASSSNAPADVRRAGTACSRGGAASRRGEHGREAVLRLRAPSTLETGRPFCRTANDVPVARRTRRVRTPRRSSRSSRSPVHAPDATAAGARACRRRRRPRASRGTRLSCSRRRAPPRAAPTTAAAVRRSRLERPDPSARRTPASGTPAVGELLADDARPRRGAAAPARGRRAASRSTSAV